MSTGQEVELRELYRKNYQTLILLPPEAVEEELKATGIQSLKGGGSTYTGYNDASASSN